MSLQDKLKPKEKIVNPVLDFENKVPPYSFNKNHSLSFGISQLKLTNVQSIIHQKHPHFSNFIVSQNSQPLVLFAEDNQSHGRIILDCGFLSYDVKTWSEDHFHNYLSNSTVWLTGIPN